MPQNNFRDDIDRVRDRVWSNPLKVCVLQHYFIGTFCFPFGPEFGCGAGVSITQGESLSLSGKFGYGGAEVGASATFTASTAWSKTSQACEWCAPQVCYPDSVMEVWECEHFLDWYSWKSEFVRFRPGRAQILPNCRIDREKCNCTETAQNAATDRQNAIGYLGAEKDVVFTSVLRTLEFRKKYGAVDSVPDKDLNQASVLTDLLFNTPFIQPCHYNQKLMVAVPGEPAISLSGDTVDDHRLALLSMENGGYQKGKLKVQKNQLLPVLAVAPKTDKPRVEISLVKHAGNDGDIVLLNQSGMVKTGKLTTIWQELVIPLEALEPGEEATLYVMLEDEKTGANWSLCAPVLMPHFDQIEPENDKKNKNRSKK